MSLLAPLKSYTDFPEGVAIPDDEIHDAMIRERIPGITQADIIRLWDDRRENQTAYQRWRDRQRQCPKCSHRSRARPLINQDAVRCRWGHVTSRLEMIQRGWL